MRLLVVSAILPLARKGLIHIELVNSGRFSPLIEGENIGDGGDNTLPDISVGSSERANSMAASAPLTSSPCTAPLTQAGAQDGGRAP